jgi:plastocyanin
MNGEEGLVLAPDMDSELILTNDTYVREIMHKYTLLSISDSLSRVSGEKGINCHSRAHQMGHIAYEELGSGAFKSCGIQCHSGCIHGATEAFFAEKGTSNLEKDIEILCSNQFSGFGTYQCLHGIGHGLMAWANYDLPVALEICDVLPSYSSRASCWGGAFMENIVGTLSDKRGSHYSDYISDDPHYPCNILNSTYQPMCYFLQTSRMLQVFSGDFAKVSQACSEAPEQSRINCFSSMGRDASGRSKGHEEKAIDYCTYAQGEYRKYCFIGVVQDQLWDESQAPAALKVCQELERFNMSDECYTILVHRSGEVLMTEESKDKFCSDIPPKFFEQCKKTTPSKFVMEDGSRTAESYSREKIRSPGQKIHIINFIGDTFTPDKIEISLGDSVTWINKGDYDFWPASNIHPTHEIYPEFDPKGPIAPGKNWTFTFTKTGIHRFHDHLYESATGVVRVN